MDTLVFEATLAGRDELKLTLTETGATLQALGCLELLNLCVEWRARLKGEPKAWPIPRGNSHPEILLREVILKARGEWEMPYKDAELCHCRVVTTEKVDAAIVTGAHTAPLVSSRTSAGTSCGTCKPDIDKLLNYRLKCQAS